MRRTSFLHGVHILAIVALLLASCSPTPTAAPAAAPPTIGAPAAAGPTGTAKPADEQPKQGGILNRSNVTDPVGLDLHLETSVWTHIPVINCYSGLVRYDPVEITKVISDLAEKWEATPDGTAYTFHLRTGVKWHDGKPFTAEDAKFNIERMAFWKENKIVSPRSGPMLSAVQSAEAPDENTLRITLKYPSASFLTNAASGWVVMLPRHVIQAKGDMKKDVLGTGPFKWKRWNSGVVIELEKNPDYFIKGRPYLDGIRIYTIRDASARLAAFRTGQVKMTSGGVEGLTHAEAELVRKEMADTAVVFSFPAFSRYMFIAKTNQAPWNDVRVRRAVDLAFDRQAAIKINSNVGILGAAMHPQGAWGIPEEELKSRPGYRQPKDADIAEAKRLLAEAGHADGFRTKLLGRTGNVLERHAVVTKDQLAKIGIIADLDIRENAVALDVINKRQFDTATWIFGDAVDDPDGILGTYYLTGGSRNFAEYSSKEFDQLYDKQFFDRLAP